MEGISDTLTLSEGDRPNFLIHGRYLRYIYFVGKVLTTQCVYILRERRGRGGEREREREREREHTDVHHSLPTLVGFFFFFFFLRLLLKE